MPETIRSRTLIPEPWTRPVCRMKQGTLFLHRSELYSRLRGPQGPVRVRNLTLGVVETFEPSTQVHPVRVEYSAEDQDEYRDEIRGVEGLW